MSRFKLGLTMGLAAGYVLGTKAGRERYLQMERSARRASRLWHKAASSSIGQKLAHKVGSAMGNKVKTAGRTTIGKMPWMKDRVADRHSRNGFEDHQPASSF